MGRQLKRVPLDFDWPLNRIWPGYMVSIESLLEKYYPDLDDKERSRIELQFGRLLGLPTVKYTDTEYVQYSCLEPPTGEGYQLWENTSEGSPQSPVFATLQELCAWCAEHATTFAKHKATAEEWEQMLSENFVYHQEGNAIFL